MVLKWLFFLKITIIAQRLGASPQTSVRCRQILPLGLFTELPWPEDSERAFRSSIQAVTCLPFKVETSNCPFLLLKMNVKQKSYEFQFL